MITAVGAFFWLIALATVFRLLRIGNEAARFRWVELGILLLLAGLLLFRPHEDIFGGEDPGSYINSGLTYNRQNQLFYIDELLSKVPPEIRPSFYYGHAGYGPTKDACLWIRNADLAMVGPHFQPAYPLMISVAARVGNASWALFVVPLFTIFTALALRALALQTIPHRWAGLIVFILYIFNPLTVWHGRCARPEIISAFMFFGGCALTLQAWQARSWKNLTDLLLGAACIGVAPLFHVTAWLFLIPTLLALVIAAIYKGRDDFLAYLIIICLALTVFYAQTKYITDYYTVKRFLDLIFMRPLIIVAGFILLTALLWLVKYLRRCRIHSEPSLQPSVSPLLSSTFGICLIAFLMTLIFCRQIYGDLPILGRPIQHYLYLTDFRVVANMLSIPVMLLILAGLIVWLTGQSEKRVYRVMAVMVMFPAVMLTGNIHDFMTTRYLMVAIIPMAALFLTALIALVLPSNAGLWKAVLLSAIICVIGVNKRSQLIMTTEHKGFCRFLRPYAEIIKTNKGMLLCEYSRIAAPLEHFFGVPTLGLDNERHDNYEPAEKAWANIMRSDPGRNAYFLTPYHAPLSDQFFFEPVYQATFQDCRLEQARQNLPTKVGKSKLTLQLYKMRLRPWKNIAASSAAPLIITPDAGNMGLRYFANTRVEPPARSSIVLPANIAGKLPQMPPDQPIKARWARASAKVLLPMPLKNEALLLIFLKAPDPDKSGYVSLDLVWNGKQLEEAREIQSNEWQWQIWRLPPSTAGAEGDLAWLTLQTDPAWNPGKPNFPADLGILISQIVCLPINK